jgi:hypothetical protein
MAVCRLLPALTATPVHDAAVAVWARNTGMAVVNIAIVMALAILALVEIFTDVPPA